MTKNKWTITDIRKIIDEVASKSEQFELLNGLELAYNGRLSRTLGRCLCKIAYSQGSIKWVEPYKLEFGKTILNVDSYETLRQVVLHETAHAIANMRYQDNCNHDSRFKTVCKEIGCEIVDASSGTASNEIRREIREMSLQLNKHKITCVGCGSEYFYNRATSVVKDIRLGKKTCVCPKCNSNDFTYTQLR